MCASKQSLSLCPSPSTSPILPLSSLFTDSPKEGEEEKEREGEGEKEREGKGEKENEGEGEGV